MMGLLERYCMWADRHPIASQVLAVTAGLLAGAAFCLLVLDPLLD